MIPNAAIDLKCLLISHKINVNIEEFIGKAIAKLIIPKAKLTIFQEEEILIFTLEIGQFTAKGICPITELKNLN